MNDLQILYNIRHQLIRRETIKQHNSSVHKKWDEAANKKIPNENKSREETWYIYQNKKNNAIKIAKFMRHFFFPIILIIISSLLAVKIATTISNDKSIGLEAIWGWCVWIVMIVSIPKFACKISDSMQKNGIAYHITVWILSFTALIGYFSVFFPEQTWEKILYILMWIFMPVTIFMLGNASWAIILILIAYMVITIITSNLALSDFNHDKKAETKSSVRIAKNNYQKKYNIWKVAHDKAKKEIEYTYINQLYYDDTDIELKKYVKFLNSSDHNIKKVNELIWCIEHNFANTITQAKQWLTIKSMLEKYGKQLQKWHQEEMNFRIQQAKIEEKRHQEQIALNNRIYKEIQTGNQINSNIQRIEQDIASGVNSIDNRLIGIRNDISNS